ncbi:hypothetical protein GCM10023322_00740 [Rugosimonospora acidiphila]|uniref:Uncharacterized protein n=1 Tax=Rugosimonospora acidiphila TaxID=556531 RepID=A0ABP9RH51_9ACTN
MTSDGPYPPGYEPAGGNPPYGRYPGDEQTEGQPPRPSASARVNPAGPWGSPAGQDQYGGGQPAPGQYGADQYGADQPGRDQSGRDQSGRDQPGYGAAPGQYRPNVQMPTESFRPPSQPSAGPAGVYGRASEPTQYGGGGGQYGGGQYGQPTQPGGAGQYGGGPGERGERGAPDDRGAGHDPYGAPTTQWTAPTQYGGSAQSGARDGAPSGTYGAPTQQYGQPTQQYGAPAQQQYGQPTDRYGSPTQQYGQPTQQYGGGQYGAGQGQYADPEAERFGPRGDADEQGPGGDGGSRRKVVLIGAVIAVVVIIAVIIIAVVAKSKGGNDYAIGSCVKEAGTKATVADCGDAGAYSIVSKAASPDKCTDQTQPYVVLHSKGSADQVLCLKPVK